MIVESSQRLPKGHMHGRREKVDHRKKMRNGIASTSKCTLAKGVRKVKIIWRGLGSDI